MTQPSIEYQVNPRFVPDDIPLWLGRAKDSAIVYDATAAELTLQTHNASAVLTDRIRVESGSDTPFLELAAGRMRLLDAAADPGAVGEMTRNGADLKVYSGGAVRSLSDLGAGAVTALNNATENEMVTVGATTTELEAEVNLKFDGSLLTVTGDANITSELFINETANTAMTTGLTINQGAADNEILALKSSDITHGLTTITETDTYGFIKKFEAGTGGLLVYGLNDTKAYAFQIRGVGAVGDSAKTTAARASVEAYAGKKSGTNIGNLGADENMFCIISDSTARYIFDVEGSAHADVEWTTYDDYNDIELLRGVHGALVPGYQEQFGRDMLYNLNTYEDMKLIGRDSVRVEHRDDGRVQLRGMVNYTGMVMLHHSTIIQMYDRFQEMIRSQDERIGQLESNLSMLGEG